MSYLAKKYESLLGLTGFSDQLLKNHFTLYEGYVTNANKLADDLAASEKQGWIGTPGYAEMKRRFGWEFNGMRLHELYFENMVKGGSAPSKEISAAIEKNFGSFQSWEKDFRSTAAMRGIGWVVLYRDAEADRLFNVWINEHDVGHFAGCKPVLVLDVFEHAYMLDYGIKRADYIEAFMKVIDWGTAENRLV